tara:strand:+ start:1128 stop:1673 length:546 start_codon:yes stop_codon:yes gene_type:complete
MAIANATGNLSFKILPNEIRKRFNGTMSYTGSDSTEKWVYKKLAVTHSVASIFNIQTDGTGDEFINISSSDALVAGDQVKFIIIKHTGFTDANENVATSNVGALITFTGDSVTPDIGEEDTQTAMFLAPGDTMALKVPASDVANWRVISCKTVASVTNGIQAGASGDNVLLEIAAIIDDGG